MISEKLNTDQKKCFFFKKKIFLRNSILLDASYGVFGTIWQNRIERAILLIVQLAGKIHVRNLNVDGRIFLPYIKYRWTALTSASYKNERLENLIGGNVYKH